MPAGSLLSVIWWYRRPSAYKRRLVALRWGMAYVAFPGLVSCIETGASQIWCNIFTPPTLPPPPADLASTYHPLIVLTPSPPNHYSPPLHSNHPIVGIECPPLYPYNYYGNHINSFFEPFLSHLCRIPYHYSALLNDDAVTHQIDNSGQPHHVKACCLAPERFRLVKKINDTLPQQGDCQFHLLVLCSTHRSKKEFVPVMNAEL
ncbi:unnamed protein product [Lepeophtheirus salmonis]|uniref:(salmon louse) hypothetical protein n=1 Tax=Lepeophtheirus salmonis TaxID=72036 RepID=A0A7R8H705_LEPSM|nr:unnamed protein product [Lepeophtheirus salmonis]CAF2899061.1 unnamed protein product [Lepeophtheirus salmonis]